MPPRLNLLGGEFGLLSVLHFAYVKNGCGWWTCVCDCGTEKTVKGSSLVSGHTKSCGCLSPDLARSRQPAYTHRMVETRQYRVWSNMLNRCRNPRSEDFANYGGRGVTVCARWESFEAFWEDMKPTYDPARTLHRVKNDVGYCKENCVWETWKVQNRNRRDNVIISTPAGPMCISEAAEEFGLKPHTIAARIRRGWPAKHLFDPPLSHGFTLGGTTKILEVSVA